MNLIKNYIPSITSAIAVFTFFLIGNTMKNDPATLSTFPDALTVISVSLVLAFFIWQKHRENRLATFRNLLGYGEKIARKSAIIFSVLCASYTLYFFSYFSTLIIFTFIVALFSFYIIGLITVLIFSSVFKYQKAATD